MGSFIFVGGCWVFYFIGVGVYYHNPGPVVDFIEINHDAGGRPVVEVPAELVCDSTHACPVVCMGPGRRMICAASREFVEDRRSVLSLWQQGLALPPGGYCQFLTWFSLYV